MSGIFCGESRFVKLSLGMDACHWMLLMHWLVDNMHGADRNLLLL